MKSFSSSLEVLWRGAVSPAPEKGMDMPGAIVNRKGGKDYEGMCNL